MGSKASEDAPEVMSGTFLFLQALLSAWPNLQHSPQSSWILRMVLLKPQEQERKLRCCKSNWFLPSFLKWNVAALPALSWLMRAHLAIFSLIFWSVGARSCSYGFIPLVKSVKGQQLSGDRGGRPSAFSSLFQGHWGLGRASWHVQFLCFLAILAAMKGVLGFSRQNTRFQWLDRCFWIGRGDWTSERLLAWRTGPQDGLRSACVSVGVIASTVPFLNVQALQPTEYDPQLCQGPGVWVWAIHWTA